ncbi:hypothetical protein LCGC14_1469510 [marine sediment metagenome]|uniref:Bacterial bifunctional deaminase-reductase C-terminal domain-containing protein n=1 Tax=marine sediment metagenome TaxID=412755 RepID=A0A0F9JCQ9_9ZZZZ|nr:dihydrofolate reductase [archaeon]
MRKIILYIATSLDNFIAKKDGNVDWLFHDKDYGYNNFYESIDTTLMGNNTYKQVSGLGEFPYKEKCNYVFTRSRNINRAPFVKFFNENVKSFVEELKNQSGKNIWLIGGSEINSYFFENHLVDELIISIHPIILGSGIPLLSKNEVVITLELMATNTYDTGLTQLHYLVKS